MKNSQQQLEQYIQKVLELQQAQVEKPLGAEELRQIASDIGISDAEWQAIQATFNGHLTRGQGHLRYNNWDDALTELQEAHILAPYDTQVLFGIASTYAGRWQAQGKTVDQRQAEQYARQCLRLDASYRPALKLLSQLTSSDRRPSASRQPWRLVVASNVVTLLLVLGGLYWWFFVKTPHAEQQPPLMITPQVTPDSPLADPLPASPTPHSTLTPTVLPATPTPALPTPTPSPRPTLTPLPTPAPPLVFTEGLGLPVSVTQDVNAAGLEFAFERASYTVFFEKSSAYEVAGWITLRGIEATYLVIVADFFGPAGKHVATKTKELLRMGIEPTMLSGDSIPFKLVEYSDRVLPELSAITLTVQQIAKQPAPATYDPFPPVTVQWLNHPPNFDIAIRERLANLSEGSFFTKKDDPASHELVLEVQNTGKSTIGELKVAIQYRDLQGQPIELEALSYEPQPKYAGPHLICDNNEPALKPGQIRVIRILDHLKNTTRAQLQGYQVTVTEIK